MGGAPQNISKPFTGDTVATPSGSNVNLIECMSEAELLAAEINAVKRGRGDSDNVSIDASGDVTMGDPSNGVRSKDGAATKKQRTDKAAGLVKTSVRKKRGALKKLPVRIRKHSVWSKLEGINAGLSLVDWLALDKNATRELQEGLRTLRSRSKRKVQDLGEFQVLESSGVVKKAQKVNLAPPGPNVVPTVRVSTVKNESDSEDGSEAWSTDSEDGYSDDDTDSIVSVASLDSVIPYPYSLERMYSSTPLRAPISINGHVIEAVFDSGASVSVMSEGLYRKLELKSNGDTMGLSSFHDKPAKRSFVCPYVNVMVAGHLRPEHFCVQPDAMPGMGSDYLILGMTWCRAYDVTINHKNGLISFPVNNGAGMAEIHGRATRLLTEHGSRMVKSVTLEDLDEGTEVLAVSVGLGQDGLLKKEVMAVNVQDVSWSSANVNMLTSTWNFDEVALSMVDLDRLMEVQDFTTALQLCGAGFKAE